MSLFSVHGLIHLIASYGPWLIGVLVALEAMGVPLPAESLLIAVSAYAGTTHKLNIVWIIAAAATGAIVGDNIGYVIGHTLGWRALRRWGRHIGLTEDRLTLGAYLFRRHGGKVVFLGRFVAILRTLAPLLAGANRMGWARFLPSNAAGGIVWTCLYALGSYWLGKAVKHIAAPVGIGIGAVAVVIAVSSFVLIRRREQALIEHAKQAMGGDRGAPAAAARRPVAQTSERA